MSFLTRKIYISGKISGLHDLNVPKFNAAEFLIGQKFCVTDVFNPHKFPAFHDKRWISYMKTCITYLMCSTDVVVLDDWNKSRGAIIEVLLACLLLIPIYTLDEMLEDGKPMKISWYQALYLFIKILLNRF